MTIDSIRNHTARHFPVQNIARATYRDILERRATENGVDFVNGVATAITPMALYETVMVKGYQYLADPDTKVDVNTAMIAAARLQALLDTRAGQPDMADTLVKVNRIIAAVKSMLPESSWPELVRRIEGDAPAEPHHHQIGAVDAADEEYERGNSTIWMTTKWMTTTGDRQPTRRWLIASGGRTSSRSAGASGCAQPLHSHAHRPDSRPSVRGADGGGASTTGDAR